MPNCTDKSDIIALVGPSSNALQVVVHAALLISTFKETLTEQIHPYRLFDSPCRDHIVEQMDVSSLKEISTTLVKEDGALLATCQGDEHDVH